MQKIRSWFHKPKKEAENLLIQPFTSEPCHDVTMVTEVMRTPQQQDSLPLDVREWGDTLTATRSFIRCQTSSPLPVWTSQLQETGESTLIHPNLSEDAQNPGRDSEPTFDTSSVTPHTYDTISLQPAVGGASNTSVSSPRLTVGPFPKTRDDFFLPPSLHQGTREMSLPCSLPCSPLLWGVRRQRTSPSSPTSPSLTSGLSRLWVEAALQRSKNNKQTKCISPVSQPHPPPQEGGGCSRMETREEGQGEWSDEEAEKENQRSTAIKPSNIIIFRPAGRHGQEEEEEEQEEQEEEEEAEDSNLWHVELMAPQYCLQMPCICFRCPSAPPYEDIQTLYPVSSDQRHNEREVEDSELSPHLYPSLSQWRGDSEIEHIRRQEMNKSCFHGNNSSDHLHHLISASVESYRSSSDHIKLKCRTCDQVFCCRCLSRVVSSLQAQCDDPEVTCVQVFTFIHPSPHSDEK